MAKVKTPGYADTPIAGSPVLDFPRGSLNFSADWRVKSDQAGKETVITNLTSPIDRPERIRLSYADVTNIYSGTAIEPSVTAATKRGVSVLTQITDVITITDDTDPDYRIDLPMSCHLVIKVPASEHISATDVQTTIGRLLSSLFDTGVETTSRLEAILRGSLVSSEL